MEMTEADWDALKCPTHGVIAAERWCVTHSRFHPLCCWGDDCRTPWDKPSSLLAEAGEAAGGEDKEE